MRTVLALNAGSSTLKFALYKIDGMALLARGLVDRWGSDDQHLKVKDRDGATLIDGALPDTPDDRKASIRFLLDWTDRTWPDASLAVVGHRIVHGGARFTGPALITPDVEAELEALCPLAPLHQPWGLSGVRLVRDACPSVPQVASFDTAFHATIAPPARRFAIPRELEAKGIRRYGFHGLSYAWIAGRLREQYRGLAKGRVIVAHLGSGASLCAMEAGRSIDTTMGFSTLDGLVMATRPGALDPGVILHLMEMQGLSSEALSDLLYHRSGLLGLSGISGDMRTLLASNEPAANEAIEVYVQRIVKEVGALATALGGLEALVFTGGVGENAEPIRTAVLARLKWLGVDQQALVIPTDEEQLIAREAVDVGLDQTPS